MFDFNEHREKRYAMVHTPDDWEERLEHEENNGYRDFEDFLAYEKRKNEKR